MRALIILGLVGYLAALEQDASVLQPALSVPEEEPVGSENEDLASRTLEHSDSRIESENGDLDGPFVLLDASQTKKDDKKENFTGTSEPEDQENSTQNPEQEIKRVRKSPNQSKKECVEVRPFDPYQKPYIVCNEDPKYIGYVNKEVYGSSKGGYVAPAVYNPGEPKGYGEIVNPAPAIHSAPASHHSYGAPASVGYGALPGKGISHSSPALGNYAAAPASASYGAAYASASAPASYSAPAPVPVHYAPEPAAANYGAESAPSANYAQPPSHPYSSPASYGSPHAIPASYPVSHPVPISGGYGRPLSHSYGAAPANILGLSKGHSTSSSSGAYLSHPSNNYGSHLSSYHPASISHVSGSYGSPAAYGSSQSGAYSSASKSISLASTPYGYSPALNSYSSLSKPHAVYGPKPSSHYRASDMEEDDLDFTVDDTENEEDMVTAARHAYNPSPYHGSGYGPIPKPAHYSSKHPIHQQIHYSQLAGNHHSASSCGIPLMFSCQPTIYQGHISENYASYGHHGLGHYGLAASHSAPAPAYSAPPAHYLPSRPATPYSHPYASAPALPKPHPSIPFPMYKPSPINTYSQPSGYGPVGYGSEGHLPAPHVISPSYRAAEETNNDESEVKGSESQIKPQTTVQTMTTQKDSHVTNNNPMVPHTKHGMNKIPDPMDNVGAGSSPKPMSGQPKNAW